MKRTLALVLSVLLMGLPALGADGTRGKPGDGGTSRVTVRSATGSVTVIIESSEGPPIVDPPDGDTTPPNINGIQVVSVSTTSTLVAAEGVWDVGSSLPLEMRIEDENGTELLPWTAKSPPYTHSFTGLTEGQEYCYRAQMRDSVPNASALTSNGTGTNGSDCVTLGTTATDEIHDGIDATCTGWDISRDDSTVISCNAGGFFDLDTGSASGHHAAALFTGSTLSGTFQNVGIKARFDEASANGLDDANYGFVLGGDCDDANNGCLVAYRYDAFGAGNGQVRIESRYWNGSDWGDLPLNQGNCDEGTVLSWVDGDYLVVLQENGWGPDGKIKAMSWSADPCSGSGCAALFDQYTNADCDDVGNPNCRDFVQIDQSDCSQIPGITSGNDAGIYTRHDASVDGIATGDWAVWEHDPETVTPTTILSVTDSIGFSVTIGQSPTPAFQSLVISNAGNTGDFGGTVGFTGGTCPGSSGDVTWLDLGGVTSFSGVTTTVNAEVSITADAGAGCTTPGDYTGTITTTCTTGTSCTSGSPATTTVTLAVRDPITSDWPDVEQRCADLGANCFCSETLEALGETPSGDSHNPTTSVTKPCPGTNGDPIWYSNSGPPSFVSVAAMTQSPYFLPAMPAGSTVSGIMMGPGPANTQLNVRSASVNVQDRTWCHRHYLALSASFACAHNGSSQGDRCKLMRNTIGQGHHETEMRGGGPGTARSTQRNDAWGGFPSPDALDVNHFSATVMRQTWTRLEVCYDHEPDDQLNVRFRATRLDTCDQTEGSATSTGSNTSFYTGNNSWIIDGYRLPRTGTLQNTHFTGYSGAMAVSAPYDPTLWPGRAPEIEGNTDCGN